MDKNTNSIKIKTEFLVNLWQELFTISQQKVTLVQTSESELDIDKLNELLGQYQEKIAAIDNLNQAIKQLHGAADPEYQKTISRIKKIALMIKKNDDLAETHLREFMQKAQAKLQSVRKNQKALQAYLQGYVNDQGWFIDQKK